MIANSELSDISIVISGDLQETVLRPLLLLVLIDVIVAGKEIKLAKAKLFIFILAFLQSLLQCAQINVEIRRRKKTSSSSHKVTKTLSDF